ncbi:hypothetical protein C8J57DRAFT_1525277 [Mycena rebaudengoi]|nr:hypothetical protein C8J57DRAFT_1525277 [Mycena rebaudengoi]
MSGLPRQTFYISSAQEYMSKFLVAHIYRRRHLPAAHPLRACGLARPALGRKWDQCVPAHTAARERSVFKVPTPSASTLIIPSSPFPPLPLLFFARLSAESHGIVSELQKTRIFLREDARDAEAPLDAVRVCVTREWCVMFLLCRRSSSMGERKWECSHIPTVCCTLRRPATPAPSSSSPSSISLPPARTNTNFPTQGAIVASGAFAGWFSQFFGRRTTLT